MSRIGVNFLILTGIILCIASVTNPIAAQHLSFNKLTFDEGLSNNTVLSVLRDQSGLLWIGTRDGLNRYDGYRIKNYRWEEDDERSISTNNYIYTLVQNAVHGTIWIGTQDGLNIYYPDTDDFTRVKPPENWQDMHFAVLSIYFEGTKAYLGTNRGLVLIPNINNPSSMSMLVLDDCEVYSIFRGKEDFLLGTNKGAYILKGMSSVKKIEWTGIENGFVRDIKEIAEGRIWIAYDRSGIVEVNKDYQFVKHLNISNGLISNFVRSIAVDNNTDVWIGTMDGIDIYRRDKSIFTSHRLDLSDSFSLNDNSVRILYPDYQGTMWVGTNFGGLNYYNKSLYNFKLERADGRKGGLSGNLISAIAIDEDGTWWVGTERDGLNVKYPGSNSFERLSLRSHTIKSIFITRKYILVGTFDAGLARINRANLTDIQYYNTNGENGITLSQNYIGAIHEDLQGRIWLGTGQSGVDVISPDFGFVRTLDETSYPQLTNSYIKSILTSSYSEVWIGTAQGLNRIDIDLGKVKAYGVSNSNLKSNYINALYEDQEENLWIGTQESGLYLFQRRTDTFEHIPLFGEKEAYHVMAILSGTKGELVVSTSLGIVIYNTKTKQTVVRSILDGFPTNQFLSNSMAAYDDRVLVGSYKGLIDIDLSARAFNHLSPQVVLTGIEINGLDVRYLREVLDYKNLNVLDRINLKHDQSTFTVYFTSDNFINTAKNSFAYKIEGSDQDWVYSANPYVSFTNLPVGHYKLRIKTANNDGVWSEGERVLAIYVSPPFYRSVWAYLFYAMVAFIVVFLITKYALDKKQLKTRLFYEEKHHRDQELLMQSKLDFFTKISHEIRTPLTLISAPIDKLLRMGNLNVDSNIQLSLVSKNIKRLLALMEELLTFRKIDANNLELKRQIVDSQSFFYTVYQLFLSIAEDQDVEFVLRNDYEGDCYIDPVQVEKVVVNLLANAFKFTDRNSGKIKLRVENVRNLLEIHILDNGSGIGKEDLAKIFDSFYQSNNQHSSVGWGIGLALAKEIVLLHQGQIEVFSRSPEVDEGYVTKFTVKLPLTGEPTALDKAQESEWIPQEDTQDIKALDVRVQTENYKILVVEDNEELREFLCTYLRGMYKVVEAEDGVKGLQVARDEIPDIIITDIAMPHMNGFALVKALKGNQDTSHIPIVMLTAKGEASDMLRGYTYGALYYITKPFSLDMLDVRLYNVIMTIERLKSVQRKYVFQDIPVLDIPDEDALYLKKIRNTIFENISDSDFNVQVLASMMAQSQSSLLKKVKSLTGSNVSELIKEIRLEKAAQLLGQSRDISSVAYAVGFSDRKYFSKEFKKHFGVSPTDYQAKN